MLLKNICLKDSRSSLLCSMPSLMSRHCMLSEMPRLVIDHRWWHPSLIHWSFLIGSFKVSIHWGVIGWMGPWPQFHWLVEVSMRLLKGVVSNCLECVRMILVFVTDFPISFFSFEDGVTVFLLMWSWLLYTLRASSHIVLFAFHSWSRVLNVSLFGGFVVVQTNILLEKHWLDDPILKFKPLNNSPFRFVSASIYMLGSVSAWFGPQLQPRQH